MSPADGLFLLIGAWIVVAALGVVLLRNVLHAAGSMMVCFVGVGALYLTLQAELIAALQVVLYVGAITVIILFGVMLTIRRFGDVHETFNARAMKLAPILLVPLGGIVIYALAATDWPVSAEKQVFGVGVVADKLFKTDGWVVPFEIVGVLLLAALVGAIALARRDRRPGVKV